MDCNWRLNLHLKVRFRNMKMSTVSIKLNHTDLVSSWRKVCLSVISDSVFIEFLQTAAILYFWCPLMGVNWGKEREQSLPHHMCLRVLSKTAWEQVPAGFEICLIRWEGGNHKSKKFISCISSHQKGSSAGHISTSGSESWCLGLCCTGSALPANSNKTRGRENIFMYRWEKDFPCVYRRDLYGGWCSSTAQGWTFGCAKRAVQGAGVAPVLLRRGQALQICHGVCSKRCKRPASILRFR